MTATQKKMLGVGIGALLLGAAVGVFGRWKPLGPDELPILVGDGSPLKFHHKKKWKFKQGKDNEMELKGSRKTGLSRITLVSNRCLNDTTCADYVPLCTSDLPGRDCDKVNFEYGTSGQTPATLTLKVVDKGQPRQRVEVYWDNPGAGHSLKSWLHPDNEEVSTYTYGQWRLQKVQEGNKPARTLPYEAHTVIIMLSED